MATIILSAQTVAEHPVAGTVIGTLSVEGGKTNETFTFELTNDAESRFEITLNAITGLYELVVKTADAALFDFDAGQTEFNISITATSTASGNPTTVDALDGTITVVDNAAPTGITLSAAEVYEHVGTGTEIGELSAIDPNLDDSFTFELLNDAEGRFDIVGNTLVVQDGSKLDYLTQASHDVQIKVTDADGTTFEKTLTVTVKDALEQLTGTRKNNKLYGTEGADAINGLAGNDKIYGYGGDDVLNGGLGKDVMFGGAGMDTFVFDTKVKKGHFDHIRDFNSADDTIQISLSALKSFKTKIAKKDAYDDFSGKGGNKKVKFTLDKLFKKGKLDDKFFSMNKAKDSTDLVYYNKKNGFVYLDVDGSGKGKGLEIVKLQKGLTLTADDFLFV